MESIFIHIYNILRRHNYLLYIVLSLIVLISVIGISKLKLNEDINAIIPQSSETDEILKVLDYSKFTDQIIFMVESDQDIPDIESIKSAARTLNAKLESDTLVQEVKASVQSNEMLSIYRHFIENPHLYLSQDDYADIERRLSSSEVDKCVKSCYKQLISPTGIVASRSILNDPLGIAAIGLKKLREFQIDDNITTKDGLLFTKNGETLMLILKPKYASNRTDINSQLIENIDKYISEIELDSSVKIQYYGGTAVAVANAVQIKRDIIITVSLSILLLLLLFIGVFRRVKVVLLLFLPIVLGVGLAVAILSFTIGELSAISLSVGAVLIGISIDYSLHIFIHYRDSGSIKETLKHITEPILMSSITTASAFLTLSILNSEALTELGLFVAITILLVALFILTLVPLLLSKVSDNRRENSSIKLSVIWNKFTPKSSNYRWPMLSVIALSILFYFTSKDIKFSSDISKLNYTSSTLSKAETRLKEISSAAYSSMFVISSGRNFNEALESAESTYQRVKESEYFNDILSYNSISDLIFTSEEQGRKIDIWNEFWSRQNRDTIKQRFIESGAKFKIKASGFNKFYKMIEFKSRSSRSNFDILKKSITDNYTIETDSLIYISSVIKVDQSNRGEIYGSINSLPDTVIIDKGGMITTFFNSLRENFNYMVIVSQALMFLIILIFLGRVELAIITYTPIALSWIWTTGLMGLFGLEFNIFSVIVSTFIFGLGVDYSIFLLKGLQANFKFGGRSIKPYRQSIAISAFTTVAALGVLIFAKHPALRSIAFASIIGIVSVVIIANIVIPTLFRYIVGFKERRKAGSIRVITALDILVTTLFFLLFLIGTLSLTIIIPLFIILPYSHRVKKFHFHYLLSSFFKTVVKIATWSKIEIIDRDLLNFDSPSVIISNHQSHIDLALILMLNPKIIVLTNSWVWNNPFYGFIVKFADYYPLSEGVDNGIDKIESMVEQGYSVLIFPEGTRTDNGKIKRFHQGALYLADRLNLELQPLIITGLFEALPKTDFLLKPRKITMKVLPRVVIDRVDLDRGETYRVATQALTRHYREEFRKLNNDTIDPDILYRELIHNYIYKGPVLEHYARVKINMEDRYRLFDSIIPKDAKVIDIGCGYGFLPLMLKMLSNRREVIGIDYDSDKIAVAQHIVEERDGIDFRCEDITDGALESSDIYILNDVLHYISKERQDKLLSTCYNRLNIGGKIIIRDANSDDKKGTKGTAFSEFLSIKILKFNKMKYEDIRFISGSELIDSAERANFKVKVIDDNRFTSNTTYILER